MSRRTIAVILAALMAFAIMGAAFAIPVGDYYVESDGLWEETNGLAGLQRTVDAGPDGNFGTSDDIPADTQHLAL